MPKVEMGRKITRPDDLAADVVTVGKLKEAHGTAGPVSDAAQTADHDLGVVPTIYNVQAISGSVLPGDITVGLVNASQIQYICAVSGGYVHWHVIAPQA